MCMREKKKRNELFLKFTKTTFMRIWTPATSTFHSPADHFRSGVICKIVIQTENSVGLSVCLWGCGNSQMHKWSETHKIVVFNHKHIAGIVTVDAWFHHKSIYVCTCPCPCQCPWPCQYGHVPMTVSPHFIGISKYITALKKKNVALSHRTHRTTDFLFILRSMHLHLQWSVYEWTYKRMLHWIFPSFNT